MKKILLYLISIIFIIFLSPKVYAYTSTNENTYFKYDIPENVYLRTSCIDTSCSMTYYDFFESLVEYNNLGYYNKHFMIYYNRSSSNSIENVRVLVLRDNYITIGLSPYGVSSSGKSTFYLYNFTEQFYSYLYSIPTNTNKITTSTQYLSLISCLTTGSCSNGGTYHSIAIANAYTSGTIDNNSDFTFNYNSYEIQTSYSNLYYSSIPLVLDNLYSSDTSTSSFVKSISINGTNYQRNQILPDIHSLYFSDNSSRDSDIGNIYVGSIPKSTINSFKYTASFYYEDYNYVSSLVPHFLFFARQPHEGYYSYHQISCTTDTYSSIAINTDLKKVNMTLLPNGFSCSSDLSLYDNIYLNIYFVYSSSNTSIIGYNATSNYGNTTRLSDTRASYLGVYIYEVFPNLSYDFSYVLSTLRPESKAYYIADNSYVTMSLVRQNDNYVEGASYNPIIFGQDIQRNAIVYNLKNYYSGNTYLQLFINYDTIVSGQINGAYYYYNSQGVIENNIIIPRDPKNNSGQYDTSHYNNIVTEYISTLSNDIFSFSQLTQKAFDTAPEFIQLLIYVAFILFCLHFIMKLVRK